MASGELCTNCMLWWWTVSCIKSRVAQCTSDSVNAIPLGTGTHDEPLLFYTPASRVLTLQLQYYVATFSALSSGVTGFPSHSTTPG